MEEAFMFSWRKIFIPLGLTVIVASFARAAEPKVWHIFATKNQTFTVEGEKKPVITVKAGETVHLRITAEKAQRIANDGTVHSFTVKELANQGWDIRLKPGTQEYTLTAPSKAGEYLVQCMVPCGPVHAEQRMKLVVEP
jgi:heme/copper-type cytochrome/quinol oxidase subunit 2